MDLEILKDRARIIQLTRRFFDRNNYLELDTPLLCDNLIPESCLEVFETKLLPSHGSKTASSPFYLIPSPEIYMKKIIAQHRENVYQICKCFRNCESIGHLHNPEFTMLEYYTMNAGYTDSLKLTEELFSYLAMEMNVPAIMPPFFRITMAEAFERWAGFNLYEAAGKKGTMEDAARNLGLDPPPGLETAVLFDLIFIHAVEPNIKTNKPVALLDYPAFVPCLAKQSKNGRTVERWELYFNGIELANCFSEETDPEKVKDFFISEAALKEQSAVVKHKVDHNYYKIFLKGFPECSGVALGLDRLIMALTNRSRIDSVLPFSF